MATPYSELRAACKQRGITQDDIAKRLDTARVTISKKMCGENPWTQTEMYGVLDMLHEPYHKMHIYFPPGGIYAGPAKDPPPTAEQQLMYAIRAYVRGEAGA